MSSVSAPEALPEPPPEPPDTASTNLPAKPLKNNKNPRKRALSAVGSSPPPLPQAHPLQNKPENPICRRIKKRGNGNSLFHWHPCSLRPSMEADFGSTDTDMASGSEAEDEIAAMEQKPDETQERKLTRLDLELEQLINMDRKQHKHKQPAPGTTSSSRQVACMGITIAAAMSTRALPAAPCTATAAPASERKASVSASAGPPGTSAPAAATTTAAATSTAYQQAKAGATGKHTSTAATAAVTAATAQTAAPYRSHPGDDEESSSSSSSSSSDSSSCSSRSHTNSQPQSSTPLSRGLAPLDGATAWQDSSRTQQDRSTTNSASHATAQPDDKASTHAASSQNHDAAANPEGKVRKRVIDEAGSHGLSGRMDATATAKATAAAARPGCHQQHRGTGHEENARQLERHAALSSRPLRRHHAME